MFTLLLALDNASNKPMVCCPASQTVLKFEMQDSLQFIVALHARKDLISSAYIMWYIITLASVVC